MNLALAGLTCVVVAGAVVAVSAREARAGLLGLLVTLLAASLLADPLTGPLAIAARLAAALLACQFIAIAIRDFSEPTSGSRLGWPVEGLAAVAAAVIGFGTHGLGAPGMGPPEAQAAGFALGVLAAAPLVTSRDVLRLGTGAILLLTGGLLVRVGLDGTPGDLDQLVAAGLVVGLGGAVAIVIVGARTAAGRLEISDEVAATARPRTARASTHLGVDRAGRSDIP